MMASQGMKCRTTIHDLEVMGLNPGRAKLGMHSTPVYVICESVIMNSFFQSQKVSIISVFMCGCLSAYCYETACVCVEWLYVILMPIVP